MREILNNIEIKSAPDSCWTPIKTKPRCEKKLAAYCHSNSIGYYLPLLKSAKRQKRKNLVFYLPMFPGYIFCLLNTENFNMIVNSNCVVNKLKTDKIQEKTLIEELLSIKELEMKSDELEICIQPEIINGKKIRIKGGPLQGFSGIVSKRKNKTLVSVNLEMLGQSISAEIDIEFIEAEED